MTTKLTDLSTYRSALRAGGKPEGGAYRVTTGAVKQVDEARRAIRFCFSDSSIDRAGDTIDANGWVTDGFEQNPVALWAHDSSAVPIGRASNLAVEDGKLMGDIEFAPPDVYPFADTIFRMVRGGYINAVSVGFLPIEYSFVENDPDRGWGVDFKRQELLEISVVPVPCNANALIEARSKGIDIAPFAKWIERALDGMGQVGITRAELEALRKAAKGADMPPARRRKEDDPDDNQERTATCGRKSDDECGLKNPEECSIHRSKEPEDDEDKRIAAIVERAVRRAMKRFGLRRAEPDEGADDGEPSIEESIRSAHFHTKMARAMRKSAESEHIMAEACLARCVKALDDGDGDEEPEPDGDEGDGGPGDGDGDENPQDKAKAAIAQLRARAAA